MSPRTSCLSLLWMLPIACGESAGEGESEAESEGEGCLTPSDDDQTAVQQAFLDVTPGGEVCFAAGTFRFTEELALDVDGATIRGAGKGEDGTVLDFSGQTAGANAIHITGDGVTVTGLRLLDPDGDGLRATEVDGITFRDLHVEWTGAASEDNGAYALYPVRSRRVLIEDTTVAGAADAAIYAGQCHDVVVRRNEAYRSVIGIEIENTVGADVYENHTHDNACGIAVFDLPGLPMLGGHSTRVHDNLVESNNHENFAAPGSLIAVVPPGTGILVLASDRNEVFANTVRDHRSLGIGVVSFCATLQDANDENYDPFPQGNFVHDNDIQDSGYDPAGQAAAIAGVAGVETLTDLIWDGAIDPAADNTGADRNCFSGNSGGEATFLQFDIASLGAGDCAAENSGGEAGTDIAPWTCTHDRLPAVEL